MNAAGEKRLIGGLVTLLIGLLAFLSWPQPDWWLARDLRSLAAVNLPMLPDGALEDCPNKVYGRIRGLLPVLADEHQKKEVLLLKGACRDGKVSLEAVPASRRAVRHLPTLPMFAADEARSARIYVGSNPQGVPVELDYKLAGVTPLMLNGLEPGSHFLRIRDRRYQAVEEQFVIGRGQARQWTFVLKAGSGRLAVSSYPSGAEILLDGVRQTAVTPAVIGPVPAGSRSLELRLGGKMRGKWQVQVPTGDTEFISIPLGDVETQPSVWRDAMSGVEFVWVAAGCYRMGCGDWTDSCEPD